MLAAARPQGAPPESEKPPPDALVGDATAGQQVFADNCSTCHGADGKGGNGGPDLSTIPDAGELEPVVKQVTDGGGGMPAFKGQLNDQQIADVAAYVTEKIHG